MKRSSRRRALLLFPLPYVGIFVPQVQPIPRSVYSNIMYLHILYYMT